MRLAVISLDRYGIIIAANMQPAPNTSIVMAKAISDNSRDDLTKIIVLTSIIDPPAETAKFRNINPLNSDIRKYLLIPRVRLVLKLFSFLPDILDKNGNIIPDINNAETK